MWEFGVKNWIYKKTSMQVSRAKRKEKKRLMRNEDNGHFRWDGRYSQAMANHRNSISQCKEEDFIKNGLPASCHRIPTYGKCPKISSNFKK